MFFKIVGKSTSQIKRKWPCGTCSFQCNDESIFCEGCKMWHHAQCDNLSVRDLKALQDLTEDYLSSTCTHAGAGVFDYENALQRLTSATYVGMLESAVKLEKIFLRNTPAIPSRTVELEFGTQSVDAVAKNILKNAGEFNLFIYQLFNNHFVASKFICFCRRISTQFLCPPFRF